MEFGKQLKSHLLGGQIWQWNFKEKTEEKKKEKTLFSFYCGVVGDVEGTAGSCQWSFAF